MSNNSNGDRLDRIEAIIESNSRAIQAMMEQQSTNTIDLQETKAIANSNSRGIQAMMEQQATDRLRHEERMARLEENLVETRQLMARMANTQSGLTRILINHDEDRPTILRRLMAIENKVDQILEQDRD